MRSIIQNLLPRCCIVCEKNSDTAYALCRQCQKSIKKTANSLQGYPLIFAPFEYSGFIRDAILQLKFHRKLIYAHILSHLFVEALQQEQEKEKIIIPSTFIPVPLHLKRQRERGFNQCIELTRHLAKQLNSQQKKNLIIRQKATQAQSGLSASNRQYNIQNAFLVKKLLPSSLVLIDDVVTTGSTLKELHRTILKKHRTALVQIWAFAKA